MKSVSPASSASTNMASGPQDVELGTVNVDSTSQVSNPRQADTNEEDLCEADHLLRLYQRAPEQLITLLSGQLTVLKTESQTILGLCGLAITVTGFSGGNVIKTGTIASGFLVAGIVFILISGAIALRAMAIIRWVTEYLDLDLKKTVRRATARRDMTRSQLVVSSMALAVGLLCYLVAVSIAALATGQLK